jgi:hypothetical protein
MCSHSENAKNTPPEIRPFQLKNENAMKEAQKISSAFTLEIDLSFSVQRHHRKIRTQSEFFLSCE